MSSTTSPTGSTGAAREWLATLACGRRLHYENSAFRPSVGERVPCRHHGYCPVITTGSQVLGSRRRGTTRAPTRTLDDLLDLLARQPVHSVRALRRQRFTLRLIVTATRRGHAVLRYGEDDDFLLTQDAASGYGVETSEAC